MWDSDDESGYSSDNSENTENGLVFSVDVGSSSAVRKLFAAKRTPTSEFRLSPGNQREDLTIAGSSLYNPDGEGYTLQVVTRSKAGLLQQNDTENMDYWFHLQADHITLERFEQLVRGIALKYHEELLLVVLSLLDIIRHEFEEVSSSGSFIQPGTVLRCDGLEQANKDKADSSALFVCFPYCDIKAGKPLELPKDGSTILLSRGLFQNAYPREPTKERDIDQVFHRMNEGKGEKYLSVSQVWAVILASGTIITCGPSSLADTFEDGIEFVDEAKLRNHGRTLIHVTDPLGHVSYLPINHCRTWLEARKAIEDKCLNSSGLDPSNYVMHAGKNEKPLDASQWPDLLKSDVSAFIHIRLSSGLQSKTESARSVTSPQRAPVTNPPSEAPLNEYLGMESDDEIVPNNSVVEVLPTWKFAPPDHLMIEYGSSSDKEETTIQFNKDIHLPRQRKPSSRDSEKMEEQSQNHVDDVTGPNTSSPDRDGGRTSLSKIKRGLAQQEESSIKDPSESNSESRASISRQRKRLSSDSSVAGPSSLSLSGRGESAPVLGDGSGLMSHAARASSVDSTTSVEPSDSTSDRPRSRFSDNDSPPGATRWNYEADPPVNPRRYKGSNESNGADSASDSPTSSHRDPRRALSSMEEAWSLQAQLEDLKEHIDENIQTALKSNSRLIKDIHDFISNVNLTQSMSQLQRRRNFIKREISAALDTQRKDKELIIAEYERKKFEDAEKAKRQREELIMQLKIEEEKMKMEEREQYERFSAKQKLKEEEERIKREKAEAELMNAMRVRLAMSGFSPPQVEAIINPNSTIPPPAQPRSQFPFSHQPHYVKVSKQHLDVDTLHYYDIPYEHDRKDPDHIIILRDMEPQETEILFEHTRRLRKTGAPALLIKAPRHSSPVRVISNPELRVPPFLAWSPTTIVSQDEATLIQITLFAIEKKMLKKRVDVPEATSSPLPIFINQKLRADITKIPQTFLEEVELKFDSASWESYMQVKSPKAVETEIPFIEKATQTAPESSSAPALDQHSLGAFSEDPVTGRRVLQWQLAHLCVEATTYFDMVQRLIDQFVPKHYDHPILGRCWGSLEVIKQAIAKINELAEVQQKVSSGSEASSKFVIRVVPDLDYLETHRVDALSTSILKCSRCRRSVRYASVEVARQHLKSVHLKNDASDVTSSSSHLLHYVVPLEIELLERKCSMMMQLLYEINTRGQKLLRKAIEIRSSVADEDNDKPSKYTLQPALVKAAEKVFELVFATMYIVTSSEVAPTDDAELWNFPSVPGKTMALLELPIEAASVSLSKARDALVLRAHTELAQKSVVHMPSTPEITVIYCLSCLSVRSVRLVELYRSHLSTLRYEAGRRPSKRILRELYLFDEEISLIAGIYKVHMRTFNDLRRVLDNESYRKPTQKRIRDFQNIEQSLIDSRARDDLPRRLKEIKNLRRRLRKTAQVLRHNIEIAEEGDSRAIMVFTIVTIIFLPLSFVAAVFGMNTADVRNMSSDQNLFWKIAIPTTAAIGALSLLTAYGGHAIRTKFDNVKKRWSESNSSASPKKRPYSSKQKLKDEETLEDVRLDVSGKVGKRRGRPLLNFRFPSAAHPNRIEDKHSQSRSQAFPSSVPKREPTASGYHYVEVSPRSSLGINRSRVKSR